MSSEETNPDGGSQGLPDVSEHDRRDEPYFTISSYGAFQAIDSLSPAYVREVFSDMPDNQLRDLADDLQNQVDDMAGDPDSHEGAIKDLAHKRSILLDMAHGD